MKKELHVRVCKKLDSILLVHSEPVIRRFLKQLWTCCFRRMRKRWQLHLQDPVITLHSCYRAAS